MSSDAIHKEREACAKLVENALLGPGECMEPFQIELANLIRARTCKEIGHLAPLVSDSTVGNCRYCSEDIILRRRAGGP